LKVVEKSSVFFFLPTVGTLHMYGVETVASLAGLQRPNVCICVCNTARQVQRSMLF